MHADSGGAIQFREWGIRLTRVDLVEQRLLC